MSLLIQHALVCTLDPALGVIEDGAVLIEGERIAEVGPARALSERHPEAEAWDARGQLALPGAICAHTHFYGAFARGMAIPGTPARRFAEILEKLWWRLDRALDEQAVRLSAQVCLVDAIRHGTTTLIDHHASPNAIEGSLDTICEAVDRSGLRAVLCYEVSDRNGSAGAQAGIEENHRFIQRARGERLAGGAAAGAEGAFDAPVPVARRRCADFRLGRPAGRLF